MDGRGGREGGVVIENVANNVYICMSIGSANHYVWKIVSCSRHGELDTCFLGK